MSHNEAPEGVFVNTDSLIKSASEELSLTEDQINAAAAFVQICTQAITTGQYDIDSRVIYDDVMEGNENGAKNPSKPVMKLNFPFGVLRSTEMQLILGVLGEVPIRIFMYGGKNNAGKVDRACILVMYTDPERSHTDLQPLYRPISNRHPQAVFPTRSTYIGFNLNTSGKLDYTRIRPIEENGSDLPMHDGQIAWNALYNNGVMY